MEVWVLMCRDEPLQVFRTREVAKRYAEKHYAQERGWEGADLPWQETSAEGATPDLYATPEYPYRIIGFDVKAR